MKTCGSPNGDWDLEHQTILVCYEMARDFANLYRGYGLAAVTVPPAKR